jgi:hypothetical protein
MFQDATMLTLDLAGGTTFGQLAEEVGKLAEFHGGLLFPVHIHLTPGHHPAQPRY